VIQLVLNLLLPHHKSANFPAAAIMAGCAEGNGDRSPRDFHGQESSGRQPVFEGAGRIPRGKIHGDLAELQSECPGQFYRC